MPGEGAVEAAARDQNSAAAAHARSLEELERELEVAHAKIDAAVADARKLEERERDLARARAELVTADAHTLEERERELADVRAELELNRGEAARARADADARSAELTASRDKLREKNFSRVADRVIPWGLGPEELRAWLEEALPKKLPTSNWAPLLNALSGLDGITLVKLCDQIDKRPWAKLTKGPDNMPLKKRTGISFGQLVCLNNALDEHGIGYYALVYQSCDRLSTLMDYQYIRKLGAGSFGDVYLMRNRHSSIEEALKSSRQRTRRSC